MFRFLSATVATILIAAVPVQADDAKTVAQGILDRGAALFNTKDAAAMAATYVEDAELSLTSKDATTGDYKAQVTRGRAAIEKFYANLYRDSDKPIQSRNVVEFAHYVGPDLLIIHGNFTPDLGSGGKPIPFVQIRTKEKDAWRILNLQLFLIEE